MVGSSWTYHRQDMGTNAEWHRARSSSVTGWLGVGRKVMTWWNGDKTEGELRMEIREQRDLIMKRVNERVAAAAALAGVSGAEAYGQEMSTKHALDSSESARKRLEELLRKAAAAVDAGAVAANDKYVAAAAARTRETAVWFQQVQLEDVSPQKDHEKAPPRAATREQQPGLVA